MDYEKTLEKVRMTFKADRFATENGAVIEETFFVEEYGYGQYVCRVITYGEDGQVLTDTYYDREGNEITP